MKAGTSYLHYVIISPVGPYFTEGFNPVSVYISDEYVRAVRGGVGEAKTGGNYAASLYVGEEARKQGYSQVLWLDAVERRYVEEVARYICFVYDGRRIVTPSLTGSILPGVTRRSVIELGRHLGYEVAEEMIDVHEMLADVKSGRITEVFGCGTAAVIAPIGKFGFRGEEIVVNGSEPGPVALRLFKSLTDIHYGRAADPFGWTYTDLVQRPLGRETTDFTDFTDFKRLTQRREGAKGAKEISRKDAKFAKKLFFFASFLPLRSLREAILKSVKSVVSLLRRNLIVSGSATRYT